LVYIEDSEKENLIFYFRSYVMDASPSWWGFFVWNEGSGRKFLIFSLIFNKGSQEIVTDWQKCKVSLHLEIK